MKKFQEKYQCSNRYGEDVHLERIVDNQYKLVCEDETIGVTFEPDNKTIKAVDPSGGPYLEVGTFVSPGVKIVGIKHSLKHQGIVLTLKFER